jgi:hypothetical protein
LSHGAASGLKVRSAADFIGGQKRHATRFADRQKGPLGREFSGNMSKASSNNNSMREEHDSSSGSLTIR